MNSLNFVREATIKKEGRKGKLYVHHWSTGWQFLIFDSHKSAFAWEKKNVNLR